jgi:hypothetical protein
MGFFNHSTNNNMGGCCPPTATVFFFLIQYSHFATSRSGDHPQEDLAKSDYKTNREVEI